MKKLLVVGVAVMCLAFAAPAMAKVTMGGMITNDTFYLDQSGESTQRGVNKAVGTQDNGFSGFRTTMPRAHNRLNAHYKSDDGNVTGVIELRAGNATPKDSTFEWYYGWLDYKLNDMIHFRIGRQPETFSIMVPSAAGMGHPLTTLLVGHGNIHASNGDMLKTYIKFNDMIRMEFAIQDPDTDSNEIIAGFPATPGGVVREENDIPRLDLAVPITIANFTIEPSATYLEQSYDQVAPGDEDSITIWGLALGVRAGFGPVTLSGEINYGQNFANGNYTGAGHAGYAAAAPAIALAWVNDAGSRQISDSDYLGWWLQADFNFGPATLKMAYGQENIQNDVGPLANDDIDVTRRGYAVALPIKVAKGFTIMPNVIYFDEDDSAQIGPLNVDFGDVLLVGVQFNLKF
jgi:hypothetical protein